MSHSTDPRHAPHAGARPPGQAPEKSGRTQPMADNERQPRLPHEHDESSDSHHDAQVRPEIHKAHEDLKRGVVDTDRGAVMDKAYQRQKR